MSRLLRNVDAPLMAHGYAGAWAAHTRMQLPPTPVWIDAADQAPLLPPGKEQVYLWVGSAAPGVTPESLAAAAGLDEAERAAMSALQHEDHARAYAAAHGALRFILAQMLRCPSASIRFVAGPYGKPSLCPEIHGEAVGLHFNIAHSGGLAAAAFAASPVGIDLEMIRWHDDLMSVARNNFAQEQVTDLECCAGDARASLFFRQWTLGEALIKATGLGLNQRLDQFAFTPKGLPQLVRLEPASGRPGEWHFGLI